MNTIYAIASRIPGSIIGVLQSLVRKYGLRSTSIIVGLTAWIFSLIVAFPGTLFYRPAFFERRYLDYVALSKSLFERELGEPIMAYRLTVPFFAHWTGLTQLWAMLVFQCVAAIATLSACFFVTARRTKSPELALPLTLALSLSFLNLPSNYGPGCMDPVTHLCAVLCLLSNRLFFTIGLTIAGTMNDERFVLAIPFLVLWHLTEENTNPTFKKACRHGAAFAAGLGLVVGIRHCLTKGIWGPGIDIPVVYNVMTNEFFTKFRPCGSPSFVLGWLVFAVNALMAFRWLWLLVASYILGSVTRFPYWFRIFFICSLTAGVFSSMIVLDVSRSIGFLFPVILLAATAVGEGGVVKRISYLWKILLGMIVTPVFCINGQLPAFWLPLPFELIRYTAFTVWHVDILRDYLAPKIWPGKVLVPLDSFRR